MHKSKAGTGALTAAEKSGRVRTTVEAATSMRPAKVRFREAVLGTRLKADRDGKARMWNIWRGHDGIFAESVLQGSETLQVKFD